MNSIDEVYTAKYIIKLNIKIGSNIWDKIKSKDCYYDIQKSIKILLGNNDFFSVYLVNKSHSKLKINIIIAADKDDNSNQLFFSQIGDFTLSIDGYFNQKIFIVTDMFMVPKSVGTYTYRRIFVKTVFGEDRNSFNGFSLDLLDELYHLPNEMKAKLKVEQRLQHWKQYLEIVEKKAEAVEVDANYDSWKIKENQNHIIFHLKEKLNKNAKDTQVQLYDSNNKKHEIIVGNVIDYNSKRRELLIEMDLKFKKDFFENKKSILCDTSSILLTDKVNLIYSQRLKYGLSKFAKGKAENKELEDFIFDASKVKSFKNFNSIDYTNLLQDNLNKSQIEAINGALESKDLYLIQGPPGTGKTTVISELCYQNAIKDKKTLIVSQTNLAVDNAMNKLYNHPKIRALRKGNVQLVQEEGIQFIEDNIINTWLSNTLSLCNKKIIEIEMRLNHKQQFLEELNKLICICEKYKKNRQELSKIREVIVKIDEIIEQLKENAGDLQKKNINTYSNGFEISDCIWNVDEEKETLEAWLQEANNLIVAVKGIQETYPKNRIEKFLYLKRWLKKAHVLLDKLYLMQFSGIKEKEKVIYNMKEMKKDTEVISKFGKNEKDVKHHIERTSHDLSDLSLNIKSNHNPMINLENSLDSLKKEFDIMREKYPLVAVESILQVVEEPDIKSYYMNLYVDLEKDDGRSLEILNKWTKKISERNEKEYELMKQIYIDNANVIGVTCISSGTWAFENQYPVFDMVIIDEVSKANPPEIILSVLKAKKVVLVGDHRQLPPMIGNETYEEVAKELKINDDSIYHLKESLFEKLYKESPIMNKKMLNIQYRMHPQIMDAINQFYKLDNKGLGLSCGITNPEQERKHLCSGKALQNNNHLIWIDIPICKENIEIFSKNNYSYSNKSEIGCIKNVLLTLSMNLKNNGFTGNKEVGIISFYNNQVRLLEDEIYEKDFYKKIDNLNLRIGSVDKFQGIERDIIICSMVRNNTRGEIGFAKDPRRVNVAFSRAKELLFIVGSKELFCKKSKGSRIYSKVAETVEAYGGIRGAHDFEYE